MTNAQSSPFLLQTIAINHFIGPGWISRGKKGKEVLSYPPCPATASGSGKVSGNYQK